MTETRRLRRPDESKNVGVKRSTAALRAQALLAREGIEVPPQPQSSAPDLPHDPTDLSDPALMTSIVEQRAWADFLGGQLALAEIDEREAEEVTKNTRSIMLLQKMPTSEALRKREDTMTRITAVVDGTDEVKFARHAEMTAYARRKIIQAAYERHTDDLFVLSRELTRRTGGEDPRRKRAGRFTP